MKAGDKGKQIIYTIGHSNRPWPRFIELIKAHGIGAVIDVRTVPKSRHNPQFNEERIAKSLKKRSIAYRRLEELGGFRHAKKDSMNTGWRNLSFRGYADYMAGRSFSKGLAALEALAQKGPIAVMCAEALPWRCHRSLIADALVKRGWKVFDIMSPSSAPPHRLTPFLKVKGGTIVYPAPRDGRRPAGTGRAAGKISPGTIHGLPADLRRSLASDRAALEAWEDITPLARNEWICWAVSVKNPETRKSHIDRVCSELAEGVRRPCCWAGCPHRRKV